MSQSVSSSAKCQIDDFFTTLEHVADIILEKPQPAAVIAFCDDTTPSVRNRTLDQLYQLLQPCFGDNLANAADNKLNFQLTTCDERSIVELQPPEFDEADALAQRFFKAGARSVIRIYISSGQTSNPTPPPDCKIIIHC